MGADFASMVWHCSEITSFRTGLKPERMSQRQALHTVEICLLDCYSRSDSHKASNRFLDLALGLVPRDIALHWKSTDGPPHSLWKKEFEN